MILPNPVQVSLRQLEQSGFEAYVVGGCVRDWLLGSTPDDWDVATSALPNHVAEIFSDFSVIPTGIKHGTQTIIIDKIPIEITTFRIDGSYIDNRRPQSVTFSLNIADDLARRDFTINAMAYNPKTGIMDPFGGAFDLQKRVLRAVGNPRKRFSEDALRIMRALRFSATLNLTIETETAKALLLSASLLCNIAAERITSELNKLLLSSGSATTLEKYFSVLTQPLFGLQPEASPRNSYFTSLSFNSDSLVTRLSIFLVCSAQATKKPLLELSREFFSRMKYDNKTKASCLSILQRADASLTDDRASLCFLIRDLGIENTNCLLDARLALAKTPTEQALLSRAKEQFFSILKNGDCCQIRDLKINGRVLSSRLKLHGKDIGRALAFLLDEVICGRCKNHPDSLLAHLEKHFKKQQNPRF